MSKLCIIPARGGSKRIPRKNVKAFLGKPILLYSIETAIDSGLFDEVMVSTDDSEIAGLARQALASVPFMRSPERSGDYATTMEVILEVLEKYRELGKAFDYVCCMYPTAPFARPEHLREGLNKMLNEQLKTTFPVVSFSYPVWRGLKQEDGLIKMIWPEHITTRSQDLETVYHDAGQWYWLNMTQGLDQVFTDRSGAIVLDDLSVQDIDTPEDWRVAELKYQNLYAKDSSTSVPKTPD